MGSSVFGINWYNSFLHLFFSKSRRSSSSFCLSLYSRNFRNHFEKTIHFLIPTPSHARKTAPPMIGMYTPTPAVLCDNKPIYAIIGTMMTNERTIMIIIFRVKSSCRMTLSSISGKFAGSVPFLLPPLLIQRRLYCIKPIYLSIWLLSCFKDFLS